MEEEKRVFGVGDVARKLKVCIATLHRWHASGKLRPSYVYLSGQGAVRLYTEEDIKRGRLLKGGKHAA